MPFDIKRFVSSSFDYRTEAVELPDLKDWFGEDERPVFTVRGLTGAELAQVNETAEKNRGLESVIELFASPNIEEKIEAIKESLGLDSGARTPDDLAKRIEQLHLGSVEPKFDRPAAVKFFEVYPVEAYMLTNTIMRLTGKGKVLGGQKPCGSGKTSK